MDSTNQSEYSASDALTDALVRAGVSYVFVNTGTDYPAIIESWAKHEALGQKKPEIIICPQEMVGLCAAHGYTQVTGEPQAVFVHVDVGTQSLGGTVHNAYRSRIPAFIFAGLSPFTMEGELPGSRNSQIQFIQNVEDQASVVREYTKMTYELRSGKNIQQMVYRMLQLAKTDPQGPVYVMAAREVLEEEGWDVEKDLTRWAPSVPPALDNESVEILTDALLKASKPLVISSYLGRNKDSVGELVKLCETLAIPVAEMLQTYMNFPKDHSLHMGNEPGSLIEESDLVLVLDSDLPWMPSGNKPKEGARIFYIDIDPVKDSIPLWHIPAERFMRADSYTALKQINSRLAELSGRIDAAKVAARREEFAARHEEMRNKWKAAAAQKEKITGAFLSATINEIIDDDTIVLNETQTNKTHVDQQIVRSKPGSFFQNAGSSLGWHGGAAIGIKLACPDRDIIALTGDGSFIFSCPTAVYWMAKRYNTPFMTVIYNNQGWTAPKLGVRGAHPEGYAVKTNKYWTEFDPPAKLHLIAEAAGDAFAKAVSDPSELKKTLLEGMAAVKSGRCAVINVILPPG